MSINYLRLPVIKSSDLVSDNDEFEIDANDVPEKYKNIKINSELQIVIDNKQDFINTMQCLTFHMVKYLPDELCDFVIKNREMCKTIIDSEFTNLFHKELNVLIMTKPEHLIKRSAKHGLLILLKYALSKPETYFGLNKACNYAVGNTKEHFECFKYLYENYHRANPEVINMFVISQKMARKDVDICYLKYLNEHCCYLKNKCNESYCKHTPWYVDCAEKIVINGDLQKLQYLYDSGFEFDENVAVKALKYRNLPILQFVVKNKLPIKMRDPYGVLFMKKKVKFTEEETLQLMEFMIENGFEKPTQQSSACSGAAVRNFPSCIKFLVKHGYRIDFNNMSSAVRTGNIDLVKYFHSVVLEQNDGVIHKFYKSNIYTAAEHGHYDILVFLIENNYPIDKKWSSNYAKRRGHEKCYELLLEHGCEAYPDLKVRKNGASAWDDETEVW